jgi:hypothetical protein
LEAEKYRAEKYSIFLPHIFLLLAVGFELPNQYQLIFAAELMTVPTIIRKRRRTR